uniref:Alpha/beta superfamily-like protein n=1 Tax=uncultured bacterium W5-102b TaxID=1130996 RepID=H9BWJ5_9BACT|nr:alpha/beta superfamily-like protein [uncultured bacterium W5-102b]
MQTPVIVDSFIEGPGGVLHMQQSGIPGIGLTLVYVPGMLGRAEDFSDDYQRFAPRHCAAVSLRGRGRSAAPDHGYTFSDHVDDLEQLVDHLDQQSVVFLTHSAGSAFAAGLLQRRPNLAGGMIVIDYPPLYPAPDSSWANAVSEGRDEQAQHVISRLHLEGETVLLLDAIPAELPTLVVTGDSSEAMLGPVDAEKLYQARLSHCQVACIAGAGHEPWLADGDLFWSTITTFVEAIDTDA